MSHLQLLKIIRQFIEKESVQPNLDLQSVRDWLSCKDFNRFFHVTGHDWVLAHLHTDAFFLNSFCIDLRHIEKYRSRNILKIDFPIATHTASYCSSYQHGDETHYYERAGERGIDNNEMWPLFFFRTFEGLPKGRSAYYEILQEFLHLEGLHLVTEREAYCNLDEVGDLAEKVVVIREDGFSAILFERNALDSYLGHKSQFLCRMMEVRRTVDRKRADWHGSARNQEQVLHTEEKSCWMRLHPNVPHDLTQACDLVRAAHLLLPRKTIGYLEGNDRKYESFIVHDWKHQRVVECSSDEKHFDNYFNDTGKPFSTSPAFFKADVLLKYKSDPDKYHVTERTITCRGAWHLTTYDINDEGQVHTYIVYLGHLPYREQLHWKQYNEAPKGNISARAYKSDFEAQWSIEYNPLANIMQHVRKMASMHHHLNGRRIWAPKDDMDELINKVH